PYHAVVPLAMPGVRVVRRALAGGERPGPAKACSVGCTTPGVLRIIGRSVTLSWPRQQPRCPRA
ncbi:hypothetical protein B296_00029351, partial [Ensete ventricosum]